MYNIHSGRLAESEEPEVKSNLVEMYTANDVNIAINVSSEKLGLTGWVSKWNKVEGKYLLYDMPHWGYLLATTDIIWIARDYESGKTPSDTNATYFIFFEWTNRDRGATIYGIQGEQFNLTTDSKKIVTFKKIGTQNMHTRYSSHTPYDTTLSACDK